MSVTEFLLGNNIAIHDWAQKALDLYDDFPVHTHLNYATAFLYRLRDDGNADKNLAIASHYLHCRYYGCVTGVSPGLTMAGPIVALAYDGYVKFIESEIKNTLGFGFVPKLGKAPTSDFSVGMLAWDARGLSDGQSDSYFRWGKRKLTAARFSLPLP